MILSRIEDRRRRRRFAPSLTRSSTRTTSIQAIKAATPIGVDVIHREQGDGGKSSHYDARTQAEDSSMARLRHFAVCVNDLDKAAKFYETVFDLKRIARE